MAPSRKRKRGIRRAASRPSPIPPGYPTVIPYLAVTAGAAALDFYPKAFGAKVLARQLTPDGKLVHGRLRIGNSLFMVSNVFPGGETSPLHRPWGPPRSPFTCTRRTSTRSGTARSRRARK